LIRNIDLSLCFVDPVIYLDFLTWYEGPRLARNSGVSDYSTTSEIQNFPDFRTSSEMPHPGKVRNRSKTFQEKPKNEIVEPGD
jgi:hypothetical protein